MPCSQQWAPSIYWSILKMNALRTSAVTLPFTTIANAWPQVVIADNTENDVQGSIPFMNGVCRHWEPSEKDFAKHCTSLQPNYSLIDTSLDSQLVLLWACYSPPVSWTHGPPRTHFQCCEHLTFWLSHEVGASPCSWVIYLVFCPDISSICSLSFHSWSTWWSSSSWLRLH